MKISVLPEGSYSVDSSKKFIPFDPEKDDPKSRPASLFIHVNPFLVKTEKELILFDCGLGFAAENGKPLIHENIRRAGYSPEDVSLVLMSHLHFDHSGGMVFEEHGLKQVSFPNATYVVQRGEWEAAYSGKSSSYHTDIFDVLQRSGHIHFVDGSGELANGINYELTGGHCQYHQAFLIKENNETCFYGGDILPEPEQLLRKFAAKYDFDGRKSMELREHYGKLAAENNWSCLYYHARNRTITKVAIEENGFKIIFPA
ncbi:MBL fold metallo-hydrolase [Pedobacter sp. HMF7647]|uniref:MBL fold metallo-hydrolase n=1 Tax=Hufsiella arboris TaxID=2695275 RepID=A0A7K1Y9I4_9SPHI|nr:MBL fold metallo-hydrolase [Hufsiella arboris]